MSENLTKNLPPNGVELILARLDTIEARLTEMDSRLIAIDNRLTNVEGRLTSVEDRLDRRLAETRPIWEQVLFRLEGVDVRLTKIEQRQDGLDQKLTAFDERFVLVDQGLSSIEQHLRAHDNKFDHLSLDMRAGFKRLGRELEQLSTHYIQVRADQNDLERRMDYLDDKVDPNRSP